VSLLWAWQTESVPAHEYYRGHYSCGSGRVALSGACGHRDYNSAQSDIKVNYSGPDFYNGHPETWVCLVTNDSGSSRALEVGVLCTSARVPITHQ